MTIYLRYRNKKPYKKYIHLYYLHFSVLSSFQRFIPISAFYPYFSFRFQFPFPRFRFSVLSLPVYSAPVSAGVRRYSQAEVTCLAKFLELYLSITSLQKIYYTYLIFMLSCIVCSNLDVVPLEVYKFDIHAVSGQLYTFPIWPDLPPEETGAL